MPFPQRPLLPQTAPGEVLLVCTCYKDGEAAPNELPDEIGGRRDGDVLVLDIGVRLRVVEGAEWKGLRSGDTPALLPDGGPVPPVAVLADVIAVVGDGGPLLVDLTGIPGRGARVPAPRLGAILAALLGGSLTFDDLVDGMDVCGVYQGDDELPAFPTPTVASGRSVPVLPSAHATLLIRTSFDDEDGWRALVDAFGGADEEGRINATMDWEQVEAREDDMPWIWLVVDDRRFEGLCPGQIPALIASGGVGRLVALADARTFTEPDHPLTIVDLIEVPGRSTIVPRRVVGRMVANLQIANMDFDEFVAPAGIGAHYW